MRTDLNTTLPAVPDADGSASAVAPSATLSPAERGKVEKAAEKFEAMFIGEMLKQMRRTTREFAGDDSVYKDRVAEDMLDFADMAVADSMAGQRAFGIADAILKQVLPAADQAADRLKASALSSTKPIQPTNSQPASAALHPPAKPVALD